VSEKLVIRIRILPSSYRTRFLHHYRFEEPNWHMDAQKAIHKRLITQLSRRAHTVSSEEGKDEFAAFARWIGRKPISVDRFFRMDWDVESEYVDELDMLAPRPEHSSSNDSSMSENDEA